MKNNNNECLFCKIIKKEEPGIEIYEDEDVVCIEDINPAATYHYLIIPKKHIINAKYLKQDDEDLYDKMVATVNTIADLHNLDKSSIRTGFHWPPFTTINHLHLHVISPENNLSYLRNFIFKKNSFWFVSTDYVKSRFQKCNL